MKSLKYRCIKKLVDTYKIESDISVTDRLVCVINAYQKLLPSLSSHVFSKFSMNKDADFQKFMWFLHYFVWNFNKVRTSYLQIDFKMTDHNASILTNWIKGICHSEVSLIGYDYLGSKLIFAYKSMTGDPNLKEANNTKVNQMFKNQPKFRARTGENCHKLLRLTIFNWDLLYKMPDIWPTLFDLYEGTMFNFRGLLKNLHFPGFKCNFRIFDTIESTLVSRFCFENNYINFNISKEDSINILRAIAKTDERHQSNGAQTNMAKTKASSKKFNKYLKSYPCIRAEINFLDVPDKQKKAVIKNLNKHLLILKLTFFQPINFLLYVGKKLKHLQMLVVGYIGNNVTVNFMAGKVLIDRSKHFDELSDNNLFVFRNLKRFVFTICNYPYDQTQPFLLETILTILKGCQKTLVNFELKFYKFPDVEKIIDYIYCKKMPLKYIRFCHLDSLTAADVMKLAKLNNGNEVLIEIDQCSKKITDEDKQSVLSYISENNLNNEVVFNY